MSFEVFYNLFYNISNNNVKRFFSPVERAMSQRSQGRQFGTYGKLTLFDENGNITSNTGFNYSSQDILKFNFNDVNSNKNNQLIYLIIYSQISSELIYKTSKQREQRGLGRSFANASISKKFQIGDTTYGLSLNLTTPEEYNTLVSMGSLSFEEAQNTFSQNGKLVINGRVVGSSSKTIPSPEPGPEPEPVNLKYYY